jgi:RNA polymerase sigma-70 factor (ECF subfamily)
MKDNELIALMSQNDKHAFDQIYDRYWEKLFLFLVKVIKDEDDAKDLIQEIFVSLWIRRESLPVIDSLSAYLYTAARYKGLSYIQTNITKNNYLQSLADFLSQPDYSDDQYQSAKDLEEIIARKVETLPSKMRLVYSLSRDEGLTHKQISEKLDISDKTVKKQINNALNQIRLVLPDKNASGLFVLIFFKFLQ